MKDRSQIAKIPTRGRHPAREKIAKTAVSSDSKCGGGGRAAGGVLGNRTSSVTVPSEKWVDWVSGAKMGKGK